MVCITLSDYFPVTVGPRNRVSTTTPPPQIAAPSDPASSASSADNTVAIIGGVVAVVIVLIIAATKHHRYCCPGTEKPKISIQKLIYSTGQFSSMFNTSSFLTQTLAIRSSRECDVKWSLTTTNYNEESEVYETIEADHEYKILDKYNQAAYDYVKIPPPAKPQPAVAEAEAVQLQPTASTGDYELTHAMPSLCPHDNHQYPWQHYWDSFNCCTRWSDEYDWLLYIWLVYIQNYYNNNYYYYYHYVI